MSNEPAWLTGDTASSGSKGGFGSPSSGGDTIPERSGSGNLSGSGHDETPSAYKGCAKAFFSFMNMGMCVFMAATGALGVRMADGVNDAGVVFVGIYMCLFALILFSFEVVQICPCTFFDDIMKKNFGFLYGTIGKSLYTMFMAVLCFGLTKPADISLACGIIVGVWGPVQVAYYYRFPDHFDRKEKYLPPGVQTPAK